MTERRIDNYINLGLKRSWRLNGAELANLDVLGETLADMEAEQGLRPHPNLRIAIANARQLQQGMTYIDRPLKLEKPRKPIRKRRPGVRRGRARDEKYLAWIRTLPCAICILPWKYNLSGVIYSNVQKSPTEAAHIGPHGMSQKADDTEAMPLCHEHHTEGKESLHRLGKKFFAHHGINWVQLRKALQARYEEQQ